MLISFTTLDDLILFVCTVCHVTFDIMSSRKGEGSRPFHFDGLRIVLEIGIFLTKGKTRDARQAVLIMRIAYFYGTNIKLRRVATYEDFKTFLLICQ